MGPNRLQNMIVTVLVVFVSTMTAAFGATPPEDWEQIIPWNKAGGSESETETPTSSYSFPHAISGRIGGHASVTVYPNSDQTYSTLQATAEAGWTTMGYWEKEYEYKGCITPTPYWDAPFEIVAELSWDVGGNAENFIPWTYATSKADGQMYMNINASPDDAEADKNASAHWSGIKKELSSFQSVALSFTWPPTVSLVWDTTGKDWGDKSVQPEAHTYSGGVDNESDGGTRLDYIKIRISNKERAWAYGDTNCFESHADIDLDITKFDF